MDHDSKTRTIGSTGYARALPFHSNTDVETNLLPRQCRADRVDTPQLWVSTVVSKFGLAKLPKLEAVQES